MTVFKIISIFLILNVTSIKCDFYSSTTDTQILLKVERFLVENLEQFLQSEQQKLIDSEKLLAELEVAASNKNSSSFYDNPIGAFKILKRLTRKWQRFQNFVDLTEEQELYKENLLQIQDDEVANANDLLGAARGIARLQETYEFLTEDIANGKLQNIKLSTEMTAADCFTLGVNLFNEPDNKNAKSWLMEARRKLQIENDNKNSSQAYISTITDELILKYLIPSILKDNNFKLAQRLIALQLTYNPENPEALAIADSIKKNIEYNRLMLPEPETFSNDTSQVPTVQQLYEQTCSGKLQQTPRELRSLKCRYVDNGVPFCRLARFKLEELNLDPFVAFYHETIYENEIKKIINESESYVERSQVGGSHLNVVSDVRTSKNTWLYYSKHRFLDRLAQRLEDITGLTLKSSEELQVANYGIGGHYGPHYDFMEEPNYSYNGLGNRILTALFYISKVEMGGATAFPFLRLAVPPIYRSLVVWPNMHYSGELDYRTKHAGCPVVKGTKWICNEWFHEIGQDFLRPCKLHQDGHKSIKYKDYN